MGLGLRNPLALVHSAQSEWKYQTLCCRPSPVGHLPATVVVKLIQIQKVVVVVVVVVDLRNVTKRCVRSRRRHAQRHHTITLSLPTDTFLLLTSLLTSRPAQASRIESKFATAASMRSKAKSGRCNRQRKVNDGS